MNKIKRKEIEGALVEFLDLVCESRFEGFNLTNTAMLRRVLFFKYFLANKGNATRAAILAGYSPKSAKQQGYRTLKWLQRQISLEDYSV